MAKKPTFVFNESLGLWVSARTGRTYSPEEYRLKQERGKRGAATLASRSRLQQIEADVLDRAKVEGLAIDNHSRVFQAVTAIADGEDVKLGDHLLKLGSDEHAAALAAAAERKANAAKVMALIFDAPEEYGEPV